MYLRFSWPCLIGVGEENCGGGLGDVRKIMRAYKLLKYSAEVVDVCWINVEGSGVGDRTESSIVEENEG